MTQHEYDYDALRRQECDTLTATGFHLDIPVDEFLCDDIETGKDSYAMLFRSGNDVYALLVAAPGTEQTLADVQHMVKRMGLTADTYFPPQADPTYFYRQAIQKIKEVYPARRQWSAEDLRYYRRYAAYSPALVRVTVIGGVVRRYNRFDNSWQDVFNYSFRKVRVAHG